MVLNSPKPTPHCSPGGALDSHRRRRSSRAEGLFGPPLSTEICLRPPCFFEFCIYSSQGALDSHRRRRLSRAPLTWAVDSHRRRRLWITWALDSHRRRRLLRIWALDSHRRRRLLKIWALDSHRRRRNVENLGSIPDLDCHRRWRTAGNSRKPSLSLANSLFKTACLQKAEFFFGTVPCRVACVYVCTSVFSQACCCHTPRLHVETTFV